MARPPSAFRAFRVWQEALPLRLFAAIARRPGGTTRVGFPGRSLVVISRPESIDQVLKNTSGYDKDAPMYGAAAPFLGKSLTVSRGGDDWRLRRRVVHPVFARHRWSAASAATGRCLDDLVARWTRRAGGDANITHEMRRLCVEIACRTLFDLDEVDDPDELARDFHTVSTYVVGPAFVPFVRSRRRPGFQEAMRRIQAFVDRAGTSSPVLADVVERARLGGMSQEDLREELVGLLFAGHETLADTLTWCLHLVMQHPRVAARLRTEARQVLRGRMATFEDTSALPLTRAVVQEAMRLYPVVWLSMRRTRHDVVLDGRRLSAGSLVVWSPYAAHRDPGAWPEPDRFRPERFDGTASHRGVPGFRPFGAGARACPGADFAFAEACAALACLVQNFDLLPSPANSSIGPRPAMTLRPNADPIATIRALRVDSGVR